MKNRIILLVIVLAFVAVIACAFLYYNNGLKAVKEGNGEDIIVKIEEGTGVTGIARLLEENKVIRDQDIMKIYCRLNNVRGLQAGTYKLNNGENLKTILGHISNGEVYKDSVRITFVEGKNMRYYAKQIAANTNNTEEDVFNLLKDEKYIDSLIEKYWFLTDEIKDKEIFYPLEGYLLPDTYEFESKDVSVETIFNVILNYMDKYLSQYKDTEMPNGITIHQMLTFASIAELEGETEEDRAEIVGVFWNRLALKMPLGSDVTTYYAFGVDMGERNLTKKEIYTYSPYNTRHKDMAGMIPIGPICNPSKTAIEAAVHPKETNNYYFVADKNKKVYFTQNNDEHEKKIQELKSQGLWFTYE